MYGHRSPEKGAQEERKQVQPSLFSCQQQPVRVIEPDDNVLEAPAGYLDQRLESHDLVMNFADKEGKDADREELLSNELL